MHQVKLISFFLLGSLLLILEGCSSYYGNLKNSSEFFSRGQYELAANQLEENAKKKDNDELLYWMNLATVYHTSGQYQKSINALFKARDIADIKDYTSISEEVGSIIINDNIKPYKGEDFEKVLIHVYLAIDYALLGKTEDALVESRKVNHILDLMQSQGKRPYEQNGFAKYLAAALFDGDKEYNDAFVDYRQLFKWSPSFPFLGAPLIRMADKLQVEQELASYKKAFPDFEKNFRLPKGWGEILLVFEEGRGPVKEPDYQFSLIPRFIKQNYTSRYGILRVGELFERTQLAFDIEATAIRELDYKMGLIVTKKVGGIVAKHALGYAVGRVSDSPLVGVLTTILLRATDRADLRHWTLLPAHLQIARLAVPAGTHDVILDVGLGSGAIEKQKKKWSGVKVKAATIVVLNARAED